MNVEIEAKLRVESLKKVAARLSELGAEFHEELLQKDYYFDDADKSLTMGDRCLRLRRQSAGSVRQAVLTFKGPKAKTRLKKRQEISVTIEDAASFEKLLLALGYEKALGFEKKREIWQLDDCEVSLDELPLLGEFVEIEGPDEEKIRRVQQKLQLAHLSHIPKSYATLMSEKLDHEGIARNEIFFSDAINPGPLTTHETG